MTASPAPAELRTDNAGEVPTVIGLCLALSLLLLLIYAQTIRFDYVNFDDPSYVSDNEHVLTGMTKENLLWSLRAAHAANWHPLTWASLMLDVELFGPGPSGHHLMNLLLHMATASVLLFALRRLTGQLWPSAFVVALFAVHPLRVESVAWISERKDVLSGLFFSMILFAYAGYAKHPAGWRYGLVLLWFCLGLMSKPMLVTVPFLLFLLDFWPLGRVRFDGASSENPHPWRRLLLEKAPLIALAVAASIATIWAQGDAIKSVEQMSLSGRLANAALSYVVYILQLFWPAKLAFYYPYPKYGFPAWQVIGAFLFLAAVTAATFRVRQRQPYLLIGWLWYLGMLLPVIGLLQVGTQAHADRYTYLPEIGLLIALSWWLVDLKSHDAFRVRQPILANSEAGLTLPLALQGEGRVGAERSPINDHCDIRRIFPHPPLPLQSQGEGGKAEIPTCQNRLAHNAFRRLLFGTIAVALIFILSWCSRRQTMHWRDSMALFTHAIECTGENSVAENNLGATFERQGQFNEAAIHFRRAWEIDPQLSLAQGNYGFSLYKLGRYAEAEAIMRDIKKADSASYYALHHLGLILERERRFAEAIAEQREAIELSPTNPDAYAGIGSALYHAGRPQEAMVEIRRSLQSGNNSPYHYVLAAWIAATSVDPLARSGSEAVQWASRAVEITRGRDPVALDVLAAAYAETGDFDQAIKTGESASDQARSAGLRSVNERILTHLTFFRAGKPLREPPSYFD